MFKTTRRLIASASLAVSTIVLVLLAKFAPGFWFSFYPDFSRSTVGVIAGITSIFPFALCEIGAAALILWAIVSLVRAIRRGRVASWAAGLLNGLCLGIFLFVGLWGLNYFAPSMESRLGLPEREYTTQELREAAEYYRDMANAVAPYAPRNDDGVIEASDFSDLADIAGQGFSALQEDYPCFNGSTVDPKKLIISPLMGKMGMTGGFICLTGEATVSTTTFDASLPFTMCHEIGHRMAFAREDEANFAGFLGCIYNEDPEFIYSGYYSAFLYCYNALHRVDATAASQVWAGVGPEIAADCGRASEHHKETVSEEVSQVADKVYDTYLNAFDVDSGTQSYGEVTDLLLAWYFEEVK